MNKCYSCGSTAQLKVEPLCHVAGGVMETFRCGCGCVTKIFYEKKIVDTRVHGTLIYREGAFK